MTESSMMPLLDSFGVRTCQSAQAFSQCTACPIALPSSTHLAVLLLRVLQGPCTLYDELMGMTLR